jgi:hypothetical protein
MSHCGIENPSPSGDHFQFDGLGLATGSAQDFLNLLQAVAFEGASSGPIQQSGFQPADEPTGYHLPDWKAPVCP